MLDEVAQTPVSRSTNSSIEMASSTSSSPSKNPLHGSTSVDSTGDGDRNESSQSKSSRAISSSLLYKKGESSIASCIINLSNTILGSGMLGLPYAYAQTGHVLGTLLMIFAASSSSFALHFLSECALKDKLPSSFYSVATKALPKFTIVIDGAVAIKCFGVATSYLIVIGDVMPEAVQYMQGSSTLTNTGWQARELWITVGWLSVVPLCLLRNVDALKYTSFAAIVFVMFLGMLIVLYSCGLQNDEQLNPCADVPAGQPCRGPTDNFDTSINTGKVFSIFIFAFTCQQNIFAVVNEIKTPVIGAVNKVIGASIGLALVTYLVVAIAGYSTYGSLVKSDVLLNYPRNATTTVARVFVALLVAFSYPLQQHPARRSITSILDLLFVDPAVVARNAGLDAPPMSSQMLEEGQEKGQGQGQGQGQATKSGVESSSDSAAETAFKAERRASAARAKAAISAAQESVNDKTVLEITAKRAGLAMPEIDSAPVLLGTENGAESPAPAELTAVEKERHQAHSEKKAQAAKARAAIAAAKANAKTPRAQHSSDSGRAGDFGEDCSSPRSAQSSVASTAESSLQRPSSSSSSGSAGAGTGTCTGTGKGSNLAPPRLEGGASGGESESVVLFGWDTGMVARDFRYWATTLFFLVFSFVIALSVKDLGTVLAFVGATGSTMVSYILPGFCYYLVFDEASGAPAWKRNLALAQGCAGLIIVPVCLTFIFIKGKVSSES